MIGICVHCQCLLNLFGMEDGHNECLSCRDLREQEQCDDDYESDEENGWADR